jgi:hypothetical protein
MWEQKFIKEFKPFTKMKTKMVLFDINYSDMNTIDIQ